MVEEQPKPSAILEAPVVEDLSGSAPSPPLPPAPPTTPTIVVDTEPPSVGFTHMDAVLDSENPEQSTIQISNQMEDDDGEVQAIEVDMSYPPEEVSEYENLEKEEDETIAVEEDEFETL